MPKVLILEQSKSMRNILRERLEFEGFSIETADNARTAAALCEENCFDAVIADSRCELPLSNVPVIVLSADNDLNSAIEALKNGAVDFLTKPVDMNRLLATLRKVTDPENHSAHRVRNGTTRNRRRSAACSLDTQPIIGDSDSVCRVRSLIDKVASSDARVLITGENGTGKELVARWLHLKSNRCNAPFVEVNCAAIPSELIESELFGHERGAFTSAIKQRKGKFEQADGGTLFMDEIGDMSLSAQAKVLRALQERRISRVGSDKDIDVDVRVVAATNKNLRDEIARGNFREDLYHRIGVIVIKVPPLRERSEDIPLLIEHFIAQICERCELPPKKIDREAVEALKDMRWSGNIRELHNVVERLIVLSDKRITMEDVMAYC